MLAATRPVVERHIEALVADGLLAGDLPPYGCMYFPRVVGVDDTRALAQRLLAEFDVLVAPGEYFGAPGHIRIGFGADDMGSTMLEENVVSSAGTTHRLTKEEILRQIREAGYEPRQRTCCFEPAGERVTTGA